MIPEPWSTIVPIVVGAGLAGIFSLFGGALQSGREHDRWVRQSRMEAYSEFLVALDGWDSAATTDWARVIFDAPRELDKHRVIVADAERRFEAAASRVYLLGPDVVREAAAQYHRVALDRVLAFEQLSRADDLVALDQQDDLARVRARGLLLGLMNRAIGIGPRSWLGRRFRRVE